MYSDHLDNGERKTYWCKDNKIYSTESDGYSGTKTHVYLEDNDQWKLQKVWAQFHDIFRAGRRSKSAEIKRAFDSF